MDYIKLAHYDDMLDAVDFLDTCEPGKYETVIWDDLSSMSEGLLDEIVSSKSRGETASLADYKLIVARLRTNLLNHLVDWRRRFNYIIFTTVVTSIQNPETGTIVGAPSIIGRKLPDMVPCLFDEVWRMEASSDGAGTVKRTLATVPEGFFVAESHLDLPNRMSPEALLEYINNGIGEEDDR